MDTRLSAVSRQPSAVCSQLNEKARRERGEAEARAEAQENTTDSEHSARSESIAARSRA